MNPRYMAYVHAHGVFDPDHMLEIDAARWPGGKMCGFLLWNAHQIDVFLARECPRKERGRSWNRNLEFLAREAAYDEQLALRYPEPSIDDLVGLL